MLRLHECLQGEAFKVIKNLGHSATAYEAAKARLERKYGGKHRALTLRLEELDAFKQIREGNEKDLEHFAELLDAVVVNLTDASQETELGSGSLYITLQRKFNKNLLTKYKQWVCDNHRTEDVKTLREFIDRESEFLTTASETIAGVLSTLGFNCLPKKILTLRRNHRRSVRFARSPMACGRVRILRICQWTTGGTLLKSKNCVLDASVREKHVLGARSAG